MLSVMQQAYKKNRLNGMNKVRAALAAGYSVKYANHKSYRLDKVVNMAAAFHRKGIDDDFLVDYALGGLEATRRYGKDGDVEDKDWATAHKFFESICAMTGRITKTPTVDLSTRNSLTVIIEMPEGSNVDRSKPIDCEVQIDTQAGHSV